MRNARAVVKSLRWLLRVAIGAPVVLYATTAWLVYDATGHFNWYYLGVFLATTCALCVSVWFALTRAVEHQNTLSILIEERAAREAAEYKLNQIQKMDSIGQLTGGIAHDFNNLLTVIIGNLEMCQKLVAGNERLENYHATMRVAAERGERLTKQLLTFARRQRLEPQVFSLRNRFHEIAGMLGQALQRNIGITVNFPHDLWTIVADIHELERAILNISVNARDAMPNGGTLEFSAENYPSRGDDGLAPGEYVALRVRDNGCGMTRDVISRVFEPFFTTKETGKGTGLGMSQVYGFVTQSGGRVAIDSEIGNGTTVTIYLPRGVEAEKVPNVEPIDIKVVVGPDDKQVHVLVVEDDEGIGELAADIIADMGYSVTLVDRAQKALDVLGRGEKVDLVFSDIVMPGGMDGLELAKQVIQFHPDIPVLLTTGYAQTAIGAVHQDVPILPKPYTPTKLQTAIEEVLRARSFCTETRRSLKAVA